MNVREELGKYANFLPLETLVEAVRLPMKICPEEPRRILPSIEMKSDGPALSALFIITESYICEVGLSRKPLEFDFAPLQTIKDYRVQFATHTVTKEGSSPTAYQIARVIFRHNFGDVATMISYVGSAREEWIETVAQAIPLSSMLKK